MTSTPREDRSGVACTPPERKRPDASPCQPHTRPREGKQPGHGSGVVLAKNIGRPDTWDDRNDWGGIRVTTAYDLSLSPAEDGDYIIPWAI
jgi:hypothetical protein